MNLFREKKSIYLVVWKLFPNFAPVKPMLLAASKKGRDKNVKADGGIYTLINIRTHVEDIRMCP